MSKYIQLIAAGLVLLLASVAASAQSSSDKKFLETDSQGNVAEVELAKLALNKASNSEVKAFAQKMVHDHELLATKMKPFLDKAGVQPSGSLNTTHQRLFNKLNGLSGAEFDKEYVSAMDKDHHEDLAEFKKEIASTQNAELKNAVESGERVIQEHTAMIDALSKKMGLSVKS